MFEPEDRALWVGSPAADSGSGGGGRIPPGRLGRHSCDRQLLLLCLACTVQVPSHLPTTAHSCISLTAAPMLPRRPSPCHHSQQLLKAVAFFGGAIIVSRQFGDAFAI